ncbi:MAG: carboxypeptidase regulatory-like domain-containing protein [Bacteroidetes bacterium]|nr:carboxypeptidase regulatory-like domain-containing protein [Bacteroidota bacterium]
MKERSLFKLLYILLIPILFGCEGSTGPEGPALKGSIAGFVIPVSADGEFVGDKSGIAVTIEGTSQTTTTKSDGSFIFSGISSGVYTLVYAKAGFGLSKTVAYQYIGGGTSFIGTVYICEPPTFTVSELSFGTSATSIKITLSEPFSTSKRIQFFVSPTSTVSKDPKNYSYSTGWIATYPTGTSNFTISVTSFRDAGISSGNEAFFIAYPATDGTKISGYTDLETGRFVYTNLNNTPSNVYRIVAP